MPGRKPKPTVLKLLEGNPGRRSLKREPQPARGDLPEPPKFLGKDAQAEWWRVAPELHRLGLLTKVDLMPLAAYCVSYGRWVMAERALARLAEKDLLTDGLATTTSNGTLVQSPLVGTAHKAASDMVRYASEFGLSPVARARLAVGLVEAPPSKFDGLLGCPPPVPRQ